MFNKIFKTLAPTFIVLALILNIIPSSAHADAYWGLSGSDSFTGTVSVAMPITDLQVTGTTTLTVPVKLRVTNGTLSMATTTGLTFSGSQTGSTLYFNGTFANINNALASLRYTRASAGTDTLEVSLVNEGEVFFADTGHLYEYVPSTLTWTAARSAALLREKYGAAGYLVTVTSQAENDFVAARLANAGWMGASDSVSEGVWRWMDGPEAGVQFWSGLSNGSTVGGRYANWGTGEPNDSSGEDCAQFLTGGTGKWNDLPCTSTTLPGYVVEYGTNASNEPLAVAKNISITTATLPVVSSLTPADNATGIATTSNLTIQFSKTVSTSTGNIVIRKTADNTVFETFNVATSTALSGSGTNSITINPTIDFAESTGYYIIVPSTAFVDNSSGYFAGISASSTWNFTTGDFTSPLITDLLATTTSSTTATVTWNTNEIASTRLLYGFSLTSATTTAVTDVSPRVLAHTSTLSSLVPCSTYYFRAISADASSNTATSSEGTFKTTGCIGSVEPTSATSTQIQTSVGGTTSLQDEGSTLTVTTPSNFTSTSSSVVIQIQSLSAQTVLGEIGKPSGVSSVGNGVVFDVKAIINDATVLDSFDLPVTLSYQYSDSEIEGLNESTLVLYHYHNDQWSMLDSCVVDTVANIVTCTSPSFSIFSLFGQPHAVPVAVNSSSSRVSGMVQGCKDTKAKNYSQYVQHVPALCEYAVDTQIMATSSTMYTRNLTTGSKGGDVKSLQKFLNSKGFIVASSGAGSIGNETEMFGSLTRKALIKFQASNNIKPSIGYFGPITRAFVQR